MATNGQEEQVQNTDLKLDVTGTHGRVDATFTAPDNIPQDVAAVVLGHGVMNDKDHPLVRLPLERLAEKGVCGLRFNFPFKQRGIKQVDRRPVLLDAFRAAISWMRARLDDRNIRLIIGGKSLGARMAAALQAEDPVADGLAYLGYPLHKPDSQERLRDEDLYRIRAPQLFFAGDKDPFCHLNLLRKVCDRMESRWDLVVIENGDHSLGVSGEGSDERSGQVIDMVTEKMASWSETL